MVSPVLHLELQTHGEAAFGKAPRRSSSPVPCSKQSCPLGGAQRKQDLAWLRCESLGGELQGLSPCPAPLLEVLRTPLQVCLKEKLYFWEKKVK